MCTRKTLIASAVLLALGMTGQAFAQASRAGKQVNDGYGHSGIWQSSVSRHEGSWSIGRAASYRDSRSGSRTQ